MESRILLALCALLLNAALGGPRAFYAALGARRPLRFAAAWVRDVERRLNREHRSAGEREMRGALLAGTVLALALIFGWACGWAFRSNLRFVELLLLTLALPVRPAWDLASSIGKSLQAGNVTAARAALEDTPWKHHALLDEPGLARAGIETLAVGFSEKIVAPLLYYALFGLPGLFMAKAITFLHEQLPSSAAKAEFGQAAGWLHTALHWLPARLAALLWMVAALFLPSGRWKKSSAQIAAALAVETPRALALLSAGAALSLSLGGPGSAYSGGRWHGAGSVKASPADLRRALYLFALLHLLLSVPLGLLL